MLVWHVFLVIPLRLHASPIIRINCSNWPPHTVLFRGIDLIFCGLRVNQPCLANFSDTVPVQVRLTAGHQLVLYYS